MTENEIIAQRYRELEAHSGKPRWGWLQWLVVVLIAFIAVGIAIPTFNGTAEKTRQMRATSYARLIITLLKSYADDHDGKYPEGATSNDAFRELFKGGQIEHESIFSAPGSPYLADGNIGKAPDYSEALKPGENHWAMTRGMTDNSGGNVPLIFENPVDNSWPPVWDADAMGRAKPGRAWKGNTIVIGRNDGSVNAEKLNATHGSRVPLQPNSRGLDLFSLSGPHEFMNVAK